MIADPISDDEERVRLALGEDPDIGPLLTVLDLLIDTLKTADIDYLLMGGIASTCLGRERWTHDIDLFSRRTDARRILEALARVGFDTEETDAEWLFKASLDNQLVDVIFRSAGDITIDAEMVTRAPTVMFMGRSVRTVPPEDLVVIKAIVAAEHTPRHWYDALAVIAATELDWDYLLRRSRHGIRRVLALLLYAQSIDLPVPANVVRKLFSKLENN